MRVLISGGNGYVGRELCRMVYDEHEVCVVDSMQTGHRFDDGERKKFHLSQIDLADGPSVKDVVAAFQPQAIIHLAATHYIPECERFPDRAVATNVLGTVNLLVASPPECRFVFASSGAVYAPDERPHDEATSALAPHDVYGWTKLHGEQYLRGLAAKLGFAAVAVRLFNVIGPGETNPHVVPEIVAQLKSGRSTLRLGNLEPKRDYIDVQDAAAGFRDVALLGDIAPGETRTFNLGTGRQYSVKELLDRLREVAGIAFTVEQDPTRLRGTDRPFLSASRNRIREFCGWEPRSSLDETLRRTWDVPDLPPSLEAQYSVA